MRTVGHSLMDWHKKCTKNLLYSAVSYHDSRMTSHTHRKKITNSVIIVLSMNVSCFGISKWFSFCPRRCVTLVNEILHDHCVMLHIFLFPMFVCLYPCMCACVDNWQCICGFTRIVKLFLANQLTHIHTWLDKIKTGKFDIQHC